MDRNEKRVLKKVCLLLATYCEDTASEERNKKRKTALYEHSVAFERLAGLFK